MGGAPAIEKKSDSFAVKGVPKVTVEANNCAVTVRGWDKPEIQYSVVKIGKRRDQSPINVQANQNNGDVNIKVVNDDAPQFFEGNNVRVEVFVPKKSNLKILTNNEIRLEGVSGEIELNGEDGAINVVAFNPIDKTELACGTNTFEITVWDIKKKKIKNKLRGHFSEIISLAYNPLDHNELVSSAYDKKMIVWDVERGEIKRVFEGTLYFQICCFCFLFLCLT